MFIYMEHFQSGQNQDNECNVIECAWHLKSLKVWSRVTDLMCPFWAARWNGVSSSSFLASPWALYFNNSYSHTTQKWQNMAKKRAFCYNPFINMLMIYDRLQLKDAVPTKKSWVSPATLTTSTSPSLAATWSGALPSRSGSFSRDTRVSLSLRAHSNNTWKMGWETQTWKWCSFWHAFQQWQ